MSEQDDDQGNGDFFWTDLDQARTRLNGTVVLYRDQPHYVHSIETNRTWSDPRVPRASISPVHDLNTITRKRLDSPHFEKFRRLPTLGWVNSPRGRAYFLERVVLRGQQHGLSQSNLQIHCFSDDLSLNDEGRPDFTRFVLKQGFSDAHEGRYPSLNSVLDNISEGSAIAFSSDFCVAMDDFGIRWLFYKTKKVGLFSGANSLSLPKKTSYLRDMLIADKSFTVENIVEF